MNMFLLSQERRTHEKKGRRKKEREEKINANKMFTGLNLSGSLCSKCKYKYVWIWCLRPGVV